jgi:uncharacterized protein (DUF302 family)
MKYYNAKTVDIDFNSAIDKTKEVLKSEGFGVLSEIDIHEKLKEKLGVDFIRYKILGACHPPSAFQALQKEIHIGTMLPCNVIVRETDDGQVEVAAVDPIASMQAVENDELSSIAEDIRGKLENVISKL